MIKQVDSQFYVSVLVVRYMLGLAGVPSLIQFVGFFCMPESPRWLVSKGRMEEAGFVLRRMRNRPDVQEELDSISHSCLEDQQALEASGRGKAVKQTKPSVCWATEYIFDIDLVNTMPFAFFLG